MRTIYHMTAGLLMAAVLAGIGTPVAALDLGERPWEEAFPTPGEPLGEEVATPGVDLREQSALDAALAAANSFWDVGEAHPFAEEIGWLIEEGITTGYDDGGYHPTANVSRQAFAAFLYRLDGNAGGGQCSTSGPGPFPDVPKSHPFCIEITWLVAQGITTGYGDGEFKPNASISRQAIAAFLFRYIHALDHHEDCLYQVEVFPDVKQGGGFCEPIRWMSQTSPEPITTGYDDGTFRPSAPLTRQAMAAYLKRLRDAYPQDRSVFEYELAAGVEEYEPEVIETVSKNVLEEPEYDENGTLTRPQVAEWVIDFDPDEDHVFVVGEGFFLKPGSDLYPTGLAGRVTAVSTTDSGGSRVVVGEAPLDQLFNRLHIEEIGSGGSFENYMTDAVPLALDTASTSVGQPTGFFTDGWACKRNSGGPTSPLVLNVDYTWPEVVKHVFVVDIGLFREPEVDIWVEIRYNINVSLDLTHDKTLAGHAFGCTIPGTNSGKLERVIPIGGSGVTLGFSPHIKIAATLETSIEWPVVLTQRNGFWIRGGQAGPTVAHEVTAGTSKVVTEFELKVEAGLNLDVGLLDRVGFNAKAYVFGKASVALEFLGAPLNWGEGVRLCFRSERGIGLYLGVFADLWVARWEFKLLGHEWTIPGTTLDHCNVIYYEPLPTSPGEYGDWVNKGLRPSPSTTPEMFVPGNIGTVAVGPPGGGFYDAPDVDLGDGGFVGPAIDTTADELWVMGYGATGYPGSDPSADTLLPQPVMDIGAVDHVVPCHLGSNAAAITKDKRLWVWGANDAGQLGNGAVAELDDPPVPPSSVPGLTNVVRAFFDGSCKSVYAVLEDGSVYAWGANGYGQLGTGDTDTRTTPTLLGGVSDIQALEGYNGRMFALDGAGHVYAWGNNFVGRLGIEGVESDTVVNPTLVPGLEDIVAFATGWNTYPVAVDSAGKVWQWGVRPYPTGPYSVGYMRLDRPVMVAGLSHIVDVQIVNNTFVALADNGLVYTWGLNDYTTSGRAGVEGSYLPIGVVPGIPRIKDYIVRNSHVVALAEDGTVWTWGASGPSLGRGDDANSNSPGKVSGLDNIEQIAAGPFFGAIYARTATGELWGWGSNGGGELGNGGNVAKYRPVRAQHIGHAREVIASVAWAYVISGGA